MDFLIECMRGSAENDAKAGRMPNAELMARYPGEPAAAYWNAYKAATK